MIEAVLFDFNGVIADDEEQHRAALGVVLAGEGLSLTPQQYYSDFLGFDDRRCLREDLGDGGTTRTRPPSQADVAALAGVSSQTVSRVANNRTKVDEETRV